MCNGEFLGKDANEIWEYLHSLAKNSQVWETENASRGVNLQPHLQMEAN